MEGRFKKQDLWNEEPEQLFIKKENIARDFERMRELSILLDFNKIPFESYVSLKNLLIDLTPFGLKNKAAEIANWNGCIELVTNPIIHNPAKAADSYSGA